MVITIEDAAEAVLQLLWVREAWALTPTGDLPPLLVDTPTATGKRAPSEWNDEWPALWRRCVAHAAQEFDHDLFDAVTSSNLGSMERIALLGRLFGPSWDDRFGPEALTDGYRERSNRHREGLHARSGRPLKTQPERMSLDALVAAWHSGLARVVEIPCHGTFTRTIGPHALLVTSETRADPGRYRAALAEFNPSSR